MAGKAVLVQRGGCRFTDKARYVAAVGARAIIVYNDAKVRGEARVGAGQETGWVEGLRRMDQPLLQGCVYMRECRRSCRSTFIHP